MNGRLYDAAHYRRIERGQMRGDRSFWLSLLVQAMHVTSIRTLNTFCDLLGFESVSVSELCSCGARPTLEHLTLLCTAGTVTPDLFLVLDVELFSLDLESVPPHYRIHPLAYRAWYSLDGGDLRELVTYSEMGSSRKRLYCQPSAPAVCDPSESALEIVAIDSEDNPIAVAHFAVTFCRRESTLNWELTVPIRPAFAGCLTVDCQREWEQFISKETSLRFNPSLSGTVELA